MVTRMRMRKSVVPAPGLPDANRSHPIAAVLIGFFVSIIICFVTPYNNFVIRGAFVSDSYLPIAAMFQILLLVLCVNPLFRALCPRAVLSRRDMAIVVAMALVASVVPSHGLLRSVPYMLAGFPTLLRDDSHLARIFTKMDLPSCLFPDKMSFGADTPVSDYFIGELMPGESIPWQAWAGPVFSWGVFLVACYLLMVSLAMIVLPQWRRNERLSFPLLIVHESLIEEPEQGNLFAPLFRKRSFWIGAIAVFMLHLMAGWHKHDPLLIPAIPLDWSLRDMFTDGPLRYLPTHIHTNRIYFIFFALAYFMPSRIGFSIWFFVLAYAGYVVIGRSYCPPFYGMTISEHRFGGMLAVTVLILWLGRYHWANVARCLFKRPVTPEETRDRNAAMMFLAGCAGMFSWLLWAGVQPAWALVYIAVATMVCLTITRIIAETGMPFIKIDMSHQMNFLRLFPTRWISSTSLFFSFFFAMIFSNGSRVSGTAMAAHGMSLADNEAPRRQTNLARLLVFLMAFCIVVGWTFSLTANYHHDITLDGVERPVNSYGYRPAQLTANRLRDLEMGRFESPVYSQPMHIGFGFVLTGFLEWACLIMPKWPLHPIGLLMVNSYYANEAWISVFFGWLVKVLILRYAGARAYRAGRFFFLGLVVGEIIASAFWTIVPAMMALSGLPYERIKIQPY